MYRNIFCLSAFICIALYSCKKDANVKSENSFIRLIPADSQMAAVACFPSDDNQYIMVARNYQFKEPGNIWQQVFTSPGMIVKLNQQGQEVWRRQIDKANSFLWNAIPIRGGGFITVGYSFPESKNFSVIRYDHNANVLSIDSLGLQYQGVFMYVQNCGTMDVIQLTNGNFVFSVSDNLGLIDMTDPDFNVIAYLAYDTLQTGTRVNTMHGLTQINDSTICMTGFSFLELSVFHEIANKFMITTDLNGVMKTKTAFTDSTFSETPNFLGVNRNGVLSVSSVMNGRTASDGTWVGYINNDNAALVSGRINLSFYDSTGNFIDRKKVYNYPGYGMISTAKPTHDGGFILCGTVNQSKFNTIDNQTQVYLLKLDENYNERWSKVINTTYASFGVDVFETFDGGYFVSGHQLSNNNQFNLIAIKTDANGNF